MNIYLVNVNGFSRLALEKLANHLNIDEIIDVRMNCSRLYLQKYYQKSFLGVRYIIKMANFTYKEGYPLEYRKTVKETEYSREIGRYCSLSNEVVGVDKLAGFLLKHYFLIQKYGLTDYVTPELQASYTMGSINSLSSYLMNECTNISEIIADYKHKNKRVDRLTSLKSFKELLGILKGNILSMAAARDSLGIEQLHHWLEGQKMFQMPPLENYMEMNQSLIEEWKEENEWSPCSLEAYIRGKITEFVSFAKMNPEETHFFDVNNIAVFYNNPDYENIFKELFTPIDYEYELCCNKIKEEHIHDEGWATSMEAESIFEDLYEDMCYDKEDLDEYRYINLQSFDMSDYIQIELDCCEDTKEREKLEMKMKKWEKWKEKQMMWCVNVDEGGWVKDEKEREKMIQEIKQSEKEYDEFWYDPFCQSDCDDCEFD